ncbi:MAG: hypothetical protein AAGJ18_24105, partial [Bacteroidota bacterium]
KEELALKDKKISTLELTVGALEEAVALANTEKNQSTTFAERQEITTRSMFDVKSNQNSSKKSKIIDPIEDDLLIKLEIARNEEVVAAKHQSNNSRPQPLLGSKSAFIGKDFNSDFLNNKIKRIGQLLANNQSIINRVLESNNDEKIDKQAANGEQRIPATPSIAKLSPSAIDYQDKIRPIDQRRIYHLLKNNQQKSIFGLGEDGIMAFVTASFNPAASLKYNLDGYRPDPNAIVEAAGITSSWSWSVYGGFETKSKWSVQMGIDYDKLTIVKQSINNIRFKAAEAQRINQGYVLSVNQRSDGALGLVRVNSQLFNQVKNDGQDIEDGDLFKLSVATEQPVRIVRVPILGGYRFDLSSRFYVTPKIGVSPVWKIKDRTQLQSIDTFTDRLSVQQSAIFLTSKVTTESLETNFRTEFGYRWRPRWYLVAEPRFKYTRNALFSYKDLELRDAPFHLMVGIRFNVD